MKYLSIPILCTVAIAVLSLINPPELPETGIDFMDKVAHAIAYMALAASWIWGVLKKNIGFLKVPTTLLVIFASCSIYGLLIEILQFTITTNRNFEIPDIIANIVGSMFGIFLYKPIKNLSS